MTDVKTCLLFSILRPSTFLSNREMDLGITAKGQDIFLISKKEGDSNRLESPSF